MGHKRSNCKISISMHNEKIIIITHQKCLHELIRPGIHIATDCNAPSQVQYQVSTTGAHTRCNILQHNWPACPHRQTKKVNDVKHVFMGSCTCNTPAYTLLWLAMRRIITGKYLTVSDICNWLQLAATDRHTRCNWLRHNITLQSVATCMPGFR